MSSSGITYFVVGFDHDTDEFFVDSNIASEKFRHDTWDEGDQEWCYLDSNTDMVEDISSLTKILEVRIK